MKKNNNNKTVKRQLWREHKHLSAVIRVKGFKLKGHSQLMHMHIRYHFLI